MSSTSLPTFPQHAELIGRDRELRALHGCLDRAAVGEPQVVLLEGEAGVGKSRLLDAVAQSARERGSQVTKGMGTPLGAGLPFGVVQQVFEPLVTSLTPAQVEALGAPARYGYDLVVGERTYVAKSTETDLYQALHGLHRLSSLFAHRGPLCYVVDDLQWIDLPSLHWLLYLSRRAERLPLMVVAGRTTGATLADSLLLSELRQSASVVKVGGLEPDGVARLVAAVLGSDPTPEFTAACRRATGGYPFLLLQLLSTLQEQSVEPDARAVSQVSRYEPDELGRMILAQVNRQSPHMLALARTVAALGRPKVSLAAAVSGLSTPGAADVAQQLVGAGLLSFEDDRIGYRHSMIASAVQRSLSHSEQDRMHARAAEHLRKTLEPAPLIATHLLATTVRFGGWAIDVLRAAAGTAMADGDPKCAAGYLARALQEDPEPSARHELMVRLGLAESHYDPELAAQHLGEVVDAISEPVNLTEVTHRLAQCLYLAERYSEVGAVYEQAARRIGSRDPESRNFLELAMRSIIPSAAGERDWRRLGHSWRRHDARGRRMAALVSERAGSEGTAPELARDTALAALAHGVGLLMQEPLQAVSAITTLVRTDDLDLALYYCDRAVEEARAQGLGLSCPIMWALRSRVYHQRGELPAAKADARRALVALAGLDAPIRHFAYVYATDALIRVLVDLCELDAAEEALTRVGLAVDVPVSRHHNVLLYTRGKLRLALGDAVGALADELLCGERLTRWQVDNPAVRPWRARAVNAHLALGNRDEAMRLALADLALARKWRAATTVGRALHTVGLAATGAEALTWLTDAAETLADTGARQLRAACLLDLGTARWKAGQREAARADLRLARTLAEQCGAQALLVRFPLLPADAIEHGGTTPEPAGGVPGPAALTPHEQRVAGLVAEGATNDEVARRLLVSRRTVEFHLTSVYRKLGIKRRAQLPAALADEDPTGSGDA